MKSYSKNSSEGVRESSGLDMFFSKSDGIQQSGVFHLLEQSDHGISVLKEVKK